MPSGPPLAPGQAHPPGLDSGGASAASLPCRRCGTPLPSARFIRDLEATLRDLGQSYDLGGGRGLLQEHCPTCKRKLRADAYYQLLGKRFV